MNSIKKLVGVKNGKYSYMPILNLKNITIKKLEDRNFNTYYLIVNDENPDEVYFCFEWTLKDGWNSLVNNWESIKEVEIEYTENENNFKTYRKVVSFYSPQTEEIIT